MRSWKRVILAACLAAVGLTMAGAAIAGSSAGTTIRFIEVTGSLGDQFVDYNGNHQPDTGDAFISTTALYRWAGAKRGARLGRAETMCTIVNPKRNAAQCAGTFFVPGGTLVGVGLVTFTELGEARVPVVGGTGRYVGARGVFTSHSLSKNSNVSADTITLLP